MHHLTHYGDLVINFGPLYLFSVLRFERKHQLAKQIARIMRCFIQPIKTISERQQVLKAICESESGFCKRDFFTSTTTTASFYSLQHIRKLGGIPLRPSKYPFRLPKGIFILRKKRNDLRSNIWLHVKGFITSNGSQVIFALVDVMKLATGPDMKHKSGLKKLIKSNNNQCIDVKQLHYSNEYMVNRNETFWLLQWIL